jgi:hypothetical protein
VRLRQNEVAHLSETVYDTAPKILLRQTADSLIAAIDYRGIWFGRSIISIVLNSRDYRLEYLLGLLNSKFLNFLYHELVHEKGRVFAHVKLSKLYQLPIRVIDFSKPAEVKVHDHMVDLVEQMTALVQKLYQAKTPQTRNAVQRQADAIQGQIDKLVYELYALSNDEIAAIQGGKQIAAAIKA